MASYRDLLNQVKAEIREIDAAGALELHESDDAPLFVDVREHDEWNEGHIPGAVHVPRGFLESRIEGVAPDHDRPIVVYCAGGARSAFAAKALDELGYEPGRLARGRLHRLEAQRLRDEAAGVARRRQARAATAATS